MPFCSNCGATANGAFCSQCGRPTGAAHGQAAPVPPPEPVATPGVALVRQKTNPLILILAIIMAMLVLGGLCVAGVVAFVHHQVRRAGIDATLFRTNPGYAMAKVMLSGNPNLTEIAHDDGAGTITVRDRRNGKETTFTFDDLKRGKFMIFADGGNGDRAAVEFGTGSGKLPSWVPEYPGSRELGTYSVKASSDDGTTEGGNVTFSTSDSVSAVRSFYQHKAEALDMKMKFTAGGSDGGMLVATDEDSGRSLTVVIGSGGNGTTVNVTYARKR